MLQVAICDDSKAARDQLERLICRHETPCRVRQFGTGTSLLEAADNFDILLLDIGMRDMTGIEAAKKIRRTSDAVIIFITALKEYVFDAFDVGAFHYLLKPVNEKKFYEVFEKAVREAACTDNREPLLIKAGRSYHKVPVREIYYAENRGRKIALHTQHGELEYYGKMEELEKKLVNGFFRCHRGYLVNLQEVLSYDAGSIRIRSGETILLAKQKYHEFVAAYMDFLK